jgi:tetratricopeptide (TPR) repeat protein
VAGFPQKDIGLMKKTRPCWLLALLLAACFTLATVIVPRAAWWNAVPSAADWGKRQSQSDNVFKLLFGEGRRLFANQFFVMADVYFHSGYYPSIFDRQETDHDVAMPAHGQTEEEKPGSGDFLGPPPDWIAKFHRHFVPNQHTHLDDGGANGHEGAASVEETLPWLKLASEMNPQMIENYTVGAYWLRRLKMPEEARDFLFEGLHNNPGNSELLFDLGSLYMESFQDTNRANNVWQAGLRTWEAQSASAKTNTQAQLVYEQLAMNLAGLERDQGHWPQVVKYLQMVKLVSPDPAGIQKQIDDAEKNISPGR